jgi:hypothetical protein
MHLVLQGLSVVVNRDVWCMLDCFAYLIQIVLYIPCFEYSILGVHSGTLRVEEALLALLETIFVVALLDSEVVFAQTAGDSDLFFDGNGLLLARHSVFPPISLYLHKYVKVISTCKVFP